MTLSRRQTLALIGGGTILAAAATGGYFVTRSPDAARAPWQAAGDYEDPRMRALSYAILAPNPHNRQPWMVDLGTSDVATLYVDTNRLLPHTDPFSRQIVIGLGCFLEVLRMAALDDGWRTEVEMFPEGSDVQELDARPVARVQFIRDPEAAPDPLFAQVFDRRSLKEPFDLSRPVPASLADELAATAKHTTSGATVDASELTVLRRLSADALRIEIETPRTYKESVDLFRIGHAEVNANPDGIDFTGPLFEALHLTGQMTREAALDGTSTVYQQGVAAVLENAQTAMGFVWLVTQGNSRKDQLRTGADWVRMNMKATERALGFHPLSQPLQEYPEMAEHYGAIHEMLAGGGGTVQMLARVGYGPEVPPSPRWSVENKIIAT